MTSFYIIKSQQMKPQLLTLLFISFCVFAFADPANKKPTITGVVKDSAQKNLPYATISLFRKSQPQQAYKITYTNDKGSFKISDLDTGAYNLTISHTGFEDKQQDITISTEPVDLGSIQLSPASASLKGVVVTAKKPLIEQADDKIVFNVENDPATKTETAIDILRKTPFVSVDGENNIQVNGQSNFKVLLNGRETAMFAQNVKEALKGFPGALITKIEVITSPGAKYDAEGIGGIINIITKKKMKGYNGSVHTYATTTRFANINTNLSLKVGKLGATVNYGAGGNYNMPGRTSTITTPFVPTIFTKRTLAGSRKQSNFWNFGNAELSYEIDSVRTFSAYANVSGGWNKQVLDQTVTTDFAANPSSTSYYDLSSRNEYPTKSIGTDYIRKFSTNSDREFSIRLNGEFGNSNTFSNSVQDNPTTDRFISNRSVAVNRQYTIQSDYIHPLKNSQKLEGGLKAIIRRASSDFNSLLKYNRSEDYKVNPTNTDNFNYNQDVYSAYGTYSFKLKKTTLRLGARVEHTVIDGDFTSSSTKVQQSYTSFLPNIQSTTKLNNTTTMVLSYGKRIQRPFIWNLNPFVNNNDSLYIMYGNPGLKPQTIHNVSAQARFAMGQNFAGLTFSGSYSDDMIVQYSTFNQATGVTATTSENLGEEFQLSVNANLTLKPNKDWSIFLNGNVRYNKVKNKAIAGQENSGIGGNANLNTNYSISKRFNVSGYAGFWRSPVSIQFTYPLNTWYGLNFGYKMFKEKLNVSVGAAGFFEKERHWRVYIKDPNFETISTSTFPFRGLAMALTWNFGKLTENVSKKKGVNNDDLIGSGSN